MLWTDFSLCVSSSAISPEATDSQAVAFRGKKKVLKLRENKPLSHYRRILENALYVNLVENTALEQPPPEPPAAAVKARKALPPLPGDTPASGASGASSPGSSSGGAPRKALPTREDGGVAPIPISPIPVSSSAASGSKTSPRRGLSVSSGQVIGAGAPQQRDETKSERSQSVWVSAKAPSTRIQVVRPASQHDALALSPRPMEAPSGRSGASSAASGSAPSLNRTQSNSEMARRDSVDRKPTVAHYDGSANILGKIRQNGDTALMSLKFHFPPNFPVASKLLEVDLSDTPAKAIRFIAERLKFPIATNGIALRIPDETLAKNLPCVAQFKKSGTAPFLDMKKYRLAYYRDLLAATSYVDYVYRFEHDKDEAKKQPTSKVEALEVLGEWLWTSPDRTGTLNYKDGTAANAAAAGSGGSTGRGGGGGGVGAAWALYYSVLQANMLFFFREAPAASAKPEGVVLLKGAEITRTTLRETPVIRIVENFFGTEMIHFLAQSGMEDLGAWNSALLQASTIDSSAVAVTKVTRIQRRKSVDYATLISRGDPHTVYHNFSKLGDGGYATVWKAFDEKDSPVALKVMVLRDSTLKSILEELANHRAIEHPNIVKFIAAYFETQTGSLWVALEYCGGGTLTELCKSCAPLPEPYMAFVCRCVLSALLVLHERGLVHRDIKSNNILLGLSHEVCMVSDFGLTIKTEEVVQFQFHLLSLSLSLSLSLFVFFFSDWSRPTIRPRRRWWERRCGWRQRYF